VRERDIERALIASVEAARGECWKWVSPGLIGVPDRLCFFPKGILRIVETKAPGEEPSGPQWRRIHRLWELGFHVDVIDDLAAAQAVSAYRP